MSSVLARPGHAAQQAVPARQEHQEHLVHHAALADDDALQLGPEPADEIRALVEIERRHVARSVAGVAGVCDTAP